MRKSWHLVGHSHIYSITMLGSENVKKSTSAYFGRGGGGGWVGHIASVLVSPPLTDF